MNEFMNNVNEHPPPPPLSLPFVFSIKLELCYQLIAYSKLFSWQRYFLSHEFK